jgi:serine/threonine protein kinase
VPENFEKMQLIGEGGAATVWIAQNNTNQMIVALKQFPK